MTFSIIAKSRRLLGVAFALGSISVGRRVLQLTFSSLRKSKINGLKTCLRKVYPHDGYNMNEGNRRMTIQAYILCKVSSGSERDACKKIMDFPNVLEACIFYGEYDVIAKLRAKDLEDLDFVTEEICRSLLSIILSTTMIVARECKRKDHQSVKPFRSTKLWCKI
jgi:DNA-binding Lrp family transcriptional regulator